METNGDMSLNVLTYLFKSYYVVWKLNRGEANIETLPRFKSYYVVWKPIASLISGVNAALFKSYYVVWKLF